jgi:hypothetical protein
LVPGQGVRGSPAKLSWLLTTKPRTPPMFRPYLTAVAAVLLLAVPAGAESAPVHTDPCGNGPSLEEGVNFASQDICSVTIDTVRAAAGDPTTLKVTMLLAGNPAEVPSAHSVAWGAGDCSFIPFRTDRSGLGVRDGVKVFCGERIDDCDGPTAGITCDFEYAFEAEYGTEVAVGSKSITWTVTFDGDLADFADEHARGSVLNFGVGAAIAGPSQPTTDNAIASFTCGTDTPCGEVIGDFVFGDATYTVG